MICMLVYFSQVHRFVLCIATSIATRRLIRTWTQHDSANPTEEVSDAGSPEHLPHAHTCINKLVLHKCAAAPEQKSLKMFLYGEKPVKLLFGQVHFKRAAA